MTSEATKMTVEAFMHIEVKVIEMADWKSNLKFSVWGNRGCFEATIASEAIQMGIWGNMHIDVRVIGVAGFKYDVKYALRCH